VLDPEKLFHDPGYLTSVVLGERGGPSGAGDTAPRWRMLVLEDCDELVRAESKERAGQALSRLLNLTDGMLGQGLDVLVCLTTNEDVARLHPAVIRPGRCLAEIEIGPLDQQEAAAWLGEPVGADGATLAELYRRRAAAVPA
jgi:ATPase family protein associated with various cellular activities (AAA)